MSGLSVLRTLSILFLVAACGAEDIPAETPGPANLPGAGGAASDAPADAGDDSDGEDGEGGLASIELCDAEDYRHLIGTPVSATTFPTIVS